MQFGLEAESNGKYMIKDVNKDRGRCMRWGRKVDSFVMTANVVKKFEDSGPFPWRAGDVGRIMGL